VNVTSVGTEQLPLTSVQRSVYEPKWFTETVDVGLFIFPNVTVLVACGLLTILQVCVPVLTLGAARYVCSVPASVVLSASQAGVGAVPALAPSGLS
jgi:hypothetical protein